tara:strand:+ start:410 stop:1003 length:594 start_codon:yes stop_codon:yes gene_type:complete
MAISKVKKFCLINLFFILMIYFLNSCGIYRPVSAKDYPPDPSLRVKKNIEEGRGFRLMGGDKKGGTFDFASSNELWRASLDTIDFMPLASANYSGGIIITDWYSDNSANESLKITIRFLTNEVRSDALDIKIFKKNCGANQNCTMFEESGELNMEIKKAILKKAAIYEKENKNKNRPYRGNAGKMEGTGKSGGGFFK